MKRFLSAAIVAVLGAAGAQAASISVTDFSKPAYEGLTGSMGNSVVEDFEGFTEGNIENGWSDSAVGSFYSLGGEGSGGTVTDGTDKGNFIGNDGRKLALRDGNVYGRTSTTATLSGNGEMFLDSNDTWGIGWQASLGGGMFDRLVLVLTDATDVGATMRILAGGHSVTLSGLGNGDKRIVEIAFGGGVSTANILFENLDANGNPRKNDGFSIDDIALSAVPLPAGAWLLLGGLGALAAMRRRKQAA